MSDDRTCPGEIHCIFTELAGDYRGAADLYGEGLEIYRRERNLSGIVTVLNGLINMALRSGEYGEARTLSEEALATAREAGLLIRIYTKVGDAVSAAEIIDEYMKLAGKGRVAALNEKALVYLACTDYKHYEETLQELMELDPENATDYLQQLAMSKLERGRLREARKVLKLDL